MICFPNAKINLGLSIFDKRKDGMHNIETYLMPIPLFDILEIQKSNKFSISSSGIPINNLNDNIIVKAWELLLSTKSNIEPINIHLHKNIPIGAGLGGGSSDAAFFLKAVNGLLSLGISIPKLELLAAQIGADCPFFIRNKPQIAKGIGNVFTDIVCPINNMNLTIVFPEINISTKEAYAKITPTKGQNLSSVLLGKKSKWKSELKNDFEDNTIIDFPELSNIKNTLYNIGAMYASLSGSGSAMYALSTKPLDTSVFSKKYKIWSQVLV